jgi:hypothetical protein
METFQAVAVFTSVLGKIPSRAAALLTVLTNSSFSRHKPEMLRSQGQVVMELASSITFGSYVLELSGEGDSSRAAGSLPSKPRVRRLMCHGASRADGSPRDPESRNREAGRPGDMFEYGKISHCISKPAATHWHAYIDNQISWHFLFQGYQP